jgi:hypothetical protein
MGRFGVDDDFNAFNLGRLASWMEIACEDSAKLSQIFSIAVQRLETDVSGNQARAGVPPETLSDIGAQIRNVSLSDAVLPTGLADEIPEALYARHSWRLLGRECRRRTILSHC